MCKSKSQGGYNPSYAWRSIHSSLEVIRRGTRWRVGNGKMIHIWEDKWLPTPTTYKPISPPCFFDDFPMVSALIDLDTKRWKADLVKTIFLPFEADTILSIPLCYSLPDDKLIWLGNTKGAFTVRSAYYVALSLVETSNEGESSFGDSQSLLWKKVWHLNLLEKIRIFAWRACMNALPTKQNLRVRGVNTDDSCPLCGQGPENTMHALFNCDCSKLVWNFWVGRLVFLDGRALDVIDVALHVIRLGNPMDLETLFVTAWYIWFSRNQFVHESLSTPPGQIWDSALRLAKDFKGALSSHSFQQGAPASLWSLPPPGFHKVSVDGATCPDSSNSCIGVIIRDSTGLVTAALSKPLSAPFSPEIAEVLALENGVLLAHEMNITRVIFESDSLATVQSVIAMEAGGPLGHIISGIRSSMLLFCSWRLHHLKRDHNRATHELAQLAKSASFAQSGMHLSTRIRYLVRYDRINPVRPVFNPARNTGISVPE
nr:uncharacterized protein LOC111987752 [Quercus suber]